MINNIDIKKYFDLMISCIRLGSDADGKITKTKLAKLMYLSDFAYYSKNGVSITNAEYLKLPQGPVPLAYFDCIKILNNNDEIFIEKKGIAEMISLREDSKQNNLSKKENKIIKDVCEKWKNKKTEEVVKFTHKQIPWAVSFEGQVVPYSLIIQEEHVY